MECHFDTPRYEDDDVILTGYGDADIPDHLASEDAETARRFGWWPRQSTTETVTTAFRVWAYDWATDGPTRTFAVRDYSGQLLGGCQLQRHDNGPWTVSYWTGASHRNRGVARRALRLLLQHADREGIAELECHVAADNTASRRVSESAGFTSPVATTDSAGQRMVRYTMTRPPV